ncbi:MerR family transcriptional regulator [Arabiibacter massiliensis]|uniref:MerR family transcriptional regulator n=1 Tax=Arabiibacter massiliensis TaxID=1870985 RepID=UPI0009B9ADCC|nr:MerR family transcriptional regulator [Arabiibacter massiliensis]
MYYIGEFSKMGQTTVKTLHYYDRIGLLRPEAVDHATGYRLYTTRQLVALHRIQALRQAGLSVDEVSTIVGGADARPVLERRQTELVRERAERESMLNRIAFILANESKELSMDYQATIKDIPGCIVYTKRLTVPDYSAYFQVIPAIGRAVAEANPGLECAKPEYCFISYLDGEYKEHDISIEYNEAVTSLGNEVDGIFFRELPGVRVASVMHQGAYADLPKAYAFIMEWIEQNGYRVTESPRESYIDGIWNCEDESQWLTEIQVPVEKR